MEIYEVGGCVRDMLLGKIPNDIDYVVEAPSYKEMKDYLETNYIILYEKEEFFTIRVKEKDKPKSYLDFVLCRKDGYYHDKRRPDSVEMGTIFDDLARRDFSMNAIARKLDGTFIDPHNGQQDIVDHVIRCVGSTDRLKEDSLRLMRALRFYITLDGFKLDEPIVQCLNDPSYVDLLANISVERIAQELTKCFEYDTLKTLHVLHDFPVIEKYIFDKVLSLKPVILCQKKK